MIKYEIQGGNLPVVICYPENGQCLKTEPFIELHDAVCDFIKYE